MAVQISKKRKFVFEEDGIFKAELNKFLTQEMAEDGYSGVEVQVTQTRTEIIIMATRTENVLGEEGWRIWEFLLWFRRDVASLRTVQGYMLKRQPQKAATLPLSRQSLCITDS